ncbi:MAG TPA: tetratricopeptide repeat protein [Gemmatimonadaceae bacterium]|nr:tetratricopeptide repeat protein [Gemmatimonadaceae bacterium]
MTRTGASARPLAADDPEGWLDWVRLNGRPLLVGLIVAGALALGVLGYRASQRAGAAKAEQALARAELALGSENPQLARADLERVVNTHEGTGAATTAAMLLAQLHYDAGRYQDGVNVLGRAAGWGASRPSQAAILALTADGLESMGRHADAARRYEDAAEATRFTNERAQYLASAARAKRAAGDAPGALRVWEELARDPQSPLAPEARLRVGELSATPVTRR